MNGITILDKQGNEMPIPLGLFLALPDEEAKEEAMMYQDLMLKDSYRIDTSDPDYIKFIHRIDPKKRYEYRWFDWIFVHCKLVSQIRKLVDEKLVLVCT